MEIERKTAWVREWISCVRRWCEISRRVVPFEQVKYASRSKLSWLVREKYGEGSWAFEDNSEEIDIFGQVWRLFLFNMKSPQNRSNNSKHYHFCYFKSIKFW